jgi:hypothetical protein
MQNCCFDSVSMHICPKTVVLCIGTDILYNFSLYFPFLESALFQIFALENRESYAPSSPRFLFPVKTPS